jgi:hypothetical protein
MKGRTFALILLGFALLKTLLRRLLPKEPALAAFARQYGAEGILAVSAEEHRLLTQSYRCTACGKCDEGERARIAAGEFGYRGLMAVVLGGSRSLADYDAVGEGLRGVPDNAIAEAERACPEGVPIVPLVELIRRHGARLARLRVL